jgi:hypothetical protein
MDYVTVSGRRTFEALLPQILILSSRVVALTPHHRENPEGVNFNAEDDKFGKEKGKHRGGKNATVQPRATLP